MSYVFIDALGAAIKEGDRVQIAGTVTDEAPSPYGRIVSISDPDADYESERGYLPILPRVSVLFDDGDEDTFVASWTATGPWDEDEAPYQCNDIELMKEAQRV